MKNINTFVFNGKTILIPNTPFQFYIRPNWLDDIISHLIPQEECYFADVGANVGQSLIRAKCRHSKLKYIGFEPNVYAASITQDFIRLNQFNDCQIMCCALSNKTQTLDLNLNTTVDTCASLVDELRPKHFQQSQTILALKYDELFFDTPISFVKIDVEGSELEVIEGMKQSIWEYRPIIACEVLDSHNETTFDFTQSRADRLVQLISDLNYSIVRLHTIQPSGKLKKFTSLNTINIKQWTEESYYLNDYLFYPTENEAVILNKLEKITT